jgi:hypothetical protein
VRAGSPVTLGNQRPQRSSNTRGSGHRRCVLSRRAASRQRSSSAFKALAAPPIEPRSSARACSNVQRRIARRLLLLSAALLSTAPTACRAGRIPPRSSVFLYVSMVKLLDNSGTHSHDGRRAPYRDAVCGRASAGRASAKPVPHASLGLRIRGTRDQARRRKGTTGRGGSPGQQRKVRDACLGGHIARGFCVALSWRVLGALRPWEREPSALPEPYGRQIRGLVLCCSSRW